MRLITEVNTINIEGVDTSKKEVASFRDVNSSNFIDVDKMISQGKMLNDYYRSFTNIFSEAIIVSLKYCLYIITFSICKIIFKIVVELSPIYGIKGIGIFLIPFVILNTIKKFFETQIRVKEIEIAFNKID